MRQKTGLFAASIVAVMSCSRTDKTAFPNATSYLRGAPPIAIGESQRRFIACFIRIMRGESSDDSLQQDRRAIVATFLCLFGRPRATDAETVARYMALNAVAGMSGADRLRLVSGLARLWEVDFRREEHRILFLRDALQPEYWAVDGVAFEEEGGHVGIIFFILSRTTVSTPAQEL